MGINIDEEQTFPVANAVFQPDSTWQLFLTKSKSITRPAAFKPLSGAEVTLTTPTGKGIDLSPDEDTIYTAEGAKPKSGQHYQLKVTTPKGATIRAGNKIPPQPQFSDLSLDTSYSVSSSPSPVSGGGTVVRRSKQGLVQLTIHYPAKAKDNYLIELTLRYHPIMDDDDDEPTEQPLDDSPQVDTSRSINRSLRFHFENPAVENAS